VIEKTVTDESREAGFTLIELMIVVAIIGILASIAVSSYQTYTVRAQVTDGLNMAANAKSPVVEAFYVNGEPPANRLAAGMTPNATDTTGNYVTGVDVQNGTVGISFGNRANTQIAGTTLFLIPYETADLSVVWVCGNAAPPPGIAPMGTQAGGDTAVLGVTTVPARYLPASCR
jgi:type IV pilus assembly protein PilA